MSMLISLMTDFVEGGGKSLGGVVLEQVFRKRAEEARDIFVDALSKGHGRISSLSQHDGAAIVFRYMRAATEGAARVNLKLMADVAAGQDVEPDFFANEFLHWAEILSSLRRNEIIVLGLVYREAKRIDFSTPKTGTFWRECTDLLESERKMPPAQSDAVASSLLRTGLLSMLGGLMGMGHAFVANENLKKLGEMADLEAYYMEEPYVPAG